MQPEVDDRVQASTRTASASGRHRWSGQAERRGQDDEQQLDRDADGRPEPHHRIRTVAYIASGTGVPGLSRFQRPIAASICPHQIHEATTTSTRPR